MSHHILLRSAKTLLHILIHRQASMSGRRDEELLETTASIWQPRKHARKLNTTQSDMVIFKR